MKSKVKLDDVKFDKKYYNYSEEELKYYVA